MARFFINRPIFAAVISVHDHAGRRHRRDAAAGGAVSRDHAADGAGELHLSGASCKVVGETVAAPIEQQVIGVENMLYMSSQCTNDGGYNLTVTFEVGTNLDMAQVLVQNRVNLALPTLAQRSEADRRQRQEEVAEHSAGRQSDFAQGHVRPALSEQLRHDPASRRAGPGQRRRRCDVSGPARLQHAGLARSRTNGRPQICRPATSSLPCANRTCRSPPVRSAARRCRKARHFNTRSARWDGWSIPRSSATSS